MWYFRAVAIDLDGTLAVADAVDPSTLDAPLETSRDERRLILVTGRTMDALWSGFPGLSDRS
jgi:hydroxymethylpyrimidine pyrophosphatase-like HAD family hydrolase